jgi:hypothetical protein
VIAVPKSDGSVIIDTRVNTQGFAQGAAGLKSQFGSLASAAGKLGVAIAAAFSVKQIIAFGKEAISLGSDLQEVQNVVDVTFSTMNELVNEFAENAYKTAGLSEAMAKRYVGTFGAMAKSFQFTEDQAFNMSTSLTQLAGDVASFYNISQDLAYTKLKSVFTGETETLKDLGVVMTQTALNDYAMRKGIGKTVQQMTEQEKVALRYRFVLDQLNTASGDFLRTSDGWANQTRLLTLQFDQLKATIGQGLINVLTPAIKLLNTMLEQLQAVAEAFKTWTERVFGNAGEAGGAIGEAADAVGDLTENLQAAEKAAKKALAPFDEITKIGSTSANSNNAFGEIGGTITGNTKEDVEETTGALDAMSAMAEKLKDFLEPLEDTDLSKLKTSIEDLGQSFWDLLKDGEGALWPLWEDYLVPLAKWQLEENAPASIDALRASVDLLKESLDIATQGWSTLKDKLEGDGEEGGLKELFGDLESPMAKISERIDRLTKLLQENEGSFSKMFSGIGSYVNLILPALITLKNTAEAVLDTAEKVGEIGFETLIKSLGELLSALGDVADFFETGLNTGDWNQAFASLESAGKKLANTFVTMFNGVSLAIATVVNTIIDGLNSIGRIEIPEWVPMVGGKSWGGFDIKPVDPYQIPLPFLATGAVIPPNAPFAAVLGDQRNGRNLEAPEGLIRTIFQEEMAEFLGGMMGGFEALLEENRRLRSVVEGIEVGDTTIGQAANRYNRELNTSRGGA